MYIAYFIQLRGWLCADHVVFAVVWNYANLATMRLHTVDLCGLMSDSVDLNWCQTQVVDPFMEEVSMFSAQYTDFFLISTNFIWFNENRLSRTCTYTITA